MTVVKSVGFILIACCCTFYATRLYKPPLYVVDLSVILKEKAYKISQQNLKDDALNIALLRAKKQIEVYLNRLAKERSVTILTTPVYGDVTDLTEFVLQNMVQEQTGE